MSRLFIPNSIALTNFDAVFKDNDFSIDDKTVEISFHPKYVAMHPVGLALYAALSDRYREEGVKTKCMSTIRSLPFRTFNEWDCLLHLATAIRFIRKNTKKRDDLFR